MTTDATTATNEAELEAFIDLAVEWSLRWWCEAEETHGPLSVAMTRDRARGLIETRADVMEARERLGCPNRRGPVQ